MEEESIKIGIGYIVAILGTLTTVIGVLWALHIARYKKDEGRLDSCEQRHQEVQQQIIDLTGDYRELKGSFEAVISTADRLDSIEK